MYKSSAEELLELSKAERSKGWELLELLTLFLQVDAIHVTYDFHGKCSCSAINFGENKKRIEKEAFVIKILKLNLDLDLIYRICSGFARHRSNKPSSIERLVATNRLKEIIEFTPKEEDKKYLLEFYNSYLSDSNS